MTVFVCVCVGCDLLCDGVSFVFVCVLCSCVMLGCLTCLCFDCELLRDVGRCVFGMCSVSVCVLVFTMIVCVV